MSEHPTPDSPPTPAAPASVDVSAQRAAGRRRFLLKAGGVAVPTALTLASRPVMAWDCNTASTWGSAQGVANTSYSSYTRSRRINISLYYDETYTKANWVANSTRAGLVAPWTAIGCKSTNTAPWNNFKSLKLSHITSSAITGVGSTTLLWNYLNTSNDEYGVLMVVAWLNFVAAQKTGATPGLAKCLAPQSTNSLVAFGTPGFKGADGQTWDKTRITTYLKNNYIARMS